MEPATDPKGSYVSPMPSIVPQIVNMNPDMMNTIVRVSLAI